MNDSRERHDWIKLWEVGIYTLEFAEVCSKCGVMQSPSNMDADSCPGKVKVTLRTNDKG